MAGILAVLLPVSGLAQQVQGQPQAPGQQAHPTLLVPAGMDFTRDIPWFPHAVQPYIPRQVPAPVLSNSPRLAELIHDGKLMLHLEDAIQLAIENNLQIAVQRYTTWITDTNVLRAKSGSPIRSAQGFTSVLGSIPTPSFDPRVSTTLSWQRQSIPVNNPFLSGTGLANLTALTNYNAQANFSYSQGFKTGTTFTLSFNNTRTSSTSPAQFFNPAVNSQLMFSFTQELLNGFGIIPNTRFIIEAKNNSQAARYELANQVINIVTQVENAYWNLVYARENVKVQQANVQWAEKLLEDNKRQVEIGTLAPIEVVRAESELATDRQNLIVAQTSELQLQTQLLNLITRNPLAAGLENVEVVPLDSINVPPRIDILPYREAVQEALANRPDLLAQELQLKNADIEVRATRNALLPTVSLFGQYGASGLGGNTLRTVSVPTAFGPNRNAPVVDSNGNPVLVNGQPVYAGTPVAFQTTSTLLTGGLLDAFDAVWHNRFPTYAFGLSMSIPLRNRAAQADNAQALLQQRLSMLQLQALRNQIASDVRNAQIAIQQGLARVEAAQKARELAQQTLEAEQKKFQLGVSTNFLVIQAARDLVTAEGNELQARVALRQAIVNFNQVLGRTLKVYNITIADALSGHYSRALNIPGTPEPAFTETPPNPPTPGGGGPPPPPPPLPPPGLPACGRGRKMATGAAGTSHAAPWMRR